MNIFESIKNACQMLARNKLRSFLTMLGIVIGIMAVIVVMSAGASTEDWILGEIQSMGSNLVGVLPGKAEEEGPPTSAMGITITTLKYEDGEAIVDRGSPHIIALSMYVSGNDIINKEDRALSASFKGVSADYINIENAEIAEGRFFTKDEEMSFTKVAVLGSKIAEELFGDQNPVGEKIKIKKTNFTIIGVFKERGGSVTQNQDEEIIVPVKTAQKLLLGIDYVTLIRMKVDSEENIDRVIADVQDILRDQHNIDNPKDDDFTVRSTAQAIDMVSTITSALTFFLVAVAAISLLVGGFGIMNIMLATVEERVKEIGLRKAVGAKSSQIISQFLIETITITFLSGIIGIIVGIGVSFLAAQIINALGYTWHFIISPLSVIVSSTIAISIGIIFGVTPARKASKLDPIEALRYE